MNNQEPTTKEILEAINAFSDHVDEKFAKIESKMDSMDSRMEKVESRMVTKDYLDDKLADLRGDLVVLTRKEDAKVRMLVNILLEKKVLSKEDEKKILSMEPFPQLYV